VLVTVLQNKRVFPEIFPKTKGECPLFPKAAAQINGNQGMRVAAFGHKQTFATNEIPAIGRGSCDRQGTMI
jgi:hypothetical protein